MSLTVYIRFKEPKTIKMRRVACGSTIPLCDDNEVHETTYWRANITHNMNVMASHVPIDLESAGRKGTLYDYVWRPEEQTPPIETTDELLPILNQGIAYMAEHHAELLQYNPSNGWGNYDSFLQWLREYRNACEDYPDCMIEASR